MQPLFHRTAQGIKAIRARDFASLAYDDYLGARILLRKGMLVQGAVMAATSVEKYLKSFVAMRGSSATGHLSRSLINDVKNYGPIFDHLSEDFVSFLGMVYDMRYYDHLKKGFNVCIPQYKVLAELDFTATFMNQGLSGMDGEKEIVTNYWRDRKVRNRILFDENYLASKTLEKSAFAERKQRVLEFRMVIEHHYRQVIYVSSAVKHDAPFVVEAMKPMDSEGKAFKAVYLGPPAY